LSCATKIEESSVIGSGQGLAMFRQNLVGHLYEWDGVAN